MFTDIQGNTNTMYIMKWYKLVPIIIVCCGTFFLGFLNASKIYHHSPIIVSYVVNGHALSVCPLVSFTK